MSEIDFYDEFYERAAIMEVCGGLSREDAEREASQLVGIARKIVTTKDDSRNSQSSEKLCRSTWPELSQTDTTAPAMLWDGLLPVTEIAMLAGIGGKGKSTLARELAMAITRGDESFLGMPLHATHRRVLYVSAEDGRIKTARIMKRYGGIPASGLEFIWGAMLSHEEILTELNHTLTESPADLVIIDSLGNVFSGQQNDNSDIQNFYSKFAAIAEQTCVLFLHHIRKAGHGVEPDQVHIQGGGAFVQRSRCVLMLTGAKHDTRRYLHCEKENDVSDIFKTEAMILDFDSETKSYSATGDRVSVSDLGAIIGAGSEGKRTPINWHVLFGDKMELSRAALVKLLLQHVGLKTRQADERMKAELRLVRFGVYSLPSPSV